MKKGIYSILGAAAIAGLVVFNFSAGTSGGAKSDMALANIEALARGETSEEFTNQTCCEACWESHSCVGCDGKRHSNAHRI